MYVIIGSQLCATWRYVFTYSISNWKDNIKCDSASNVPKYPLNNGVSIVQILVVKLSNTSTMLFPPVAKTLSNLVEVFENFGRTGSYFVKFSHVTI